MIFSDRMVQLNSTYTPVDQVLKVLLLYVMFKIYFSDAPQGMMHLTELTSH